MSKEKQIEEVAKCENCIHVKVCVIRGFPSAFKNTHWEKEPCDHYRKQSVGEWNRVEEDLGDGVKTYRFACTNCGFKKNTLTGNFCPNCGAKMKGGAE